MKTKKIPLRKCIACNESKAKKDLLRIVVDQSGDKSFDETGRCNGRGAYLCRNAECIEKAFKQKKINEIVKEELLKELN